MRLDVAESLAQDFINLIKPFCERIEIAGSVRRKKPEVKDIEIVAKPLIIQEFTQTLEGSKCTGYRVDTNQLHEKLKGLKNNNIIILDRYSKDKRKPPFGLRYYRLTFQGQPLDLFCVLPPADWGVIFTIRTGPALYSQRLVTDALRNGMRVMNGSLFKSEIEKISEPINYTEEGYYKLPCPEETDFFKALGVDWIPPEERGP